MARALSHDVDPTSLKARAVACFDRAMRSSDPEISAALLELASALYFAAYAADMVKQHGDHRTERPH